MCLPTRSTNPASPRHPWFQVFLAIVLGAMLGVALAQTTAPGQLDTACATDCAARGYDSEFCGRVCVTPEAGEIPADTAIDWVCMTSCRDRGGKLRDCLPRCQRG